MTLAPSMPTNNADDAVAHFSGYVNQFHDLYQNRAEFEERFALWSGLLDKYVKPGGLSIDLGCGTGVFSYYLAEKGGRVIGVDGAAEMVNFCDEQRRQRGFQNLHFFQGRLPEVNDPRLKPADLVISSSVAEYVDDLDAMLALFAKLLKPGSALIMSMPNASSVSRTYEWIKFRLTGNPIIYKYIRHFTSPKRLQKRVRRYGLLLQESHYYTHFTRGARLARWVGLPPPLTEDLFVAVFRKQ